VKEGSCTFPAMERTPRTRVAATDADLATVAELAGRIWRAHFPSILSAGQIEYMLAWMYGAAQLREEVARGVVYELLLDEDRPFGYCAYEELPGELRLHKLYLEVADHGRGLGSFALRHVEDEARSRGLGRVVLGVNKSNEKALRAYRRNGYAIREAVKKDIGGGFFMDDFIMEKVL
jgi:ribosomal protein S18 acetylase RimI-like enzyme